MKEFIGRHWFWIEVIMFTVISATLLVFSVTVYPEPKSTTPANDGYLAGMMGGIGAFMLFILFLNVVLYTRKKYGKVNKRQEGPDAKDNN